MAAGSSPETRMPPAEHVLPLSDTRPIDIGMDHGPPADTKPAAVETAAADRALPATGSDHLPVAAGISW
ncbi:hypothetical protein [Streptomyces sp. NPDC020996]|uniref:hypothetical protein n=1 Tax=Streptomyces sp. NPDC020996 TaxID=3154791 RepID=UPI0033E404EE